jgi:hypothetical protein
MGPALETTLGKEVFRQAIEQQQARQGGAVGPQPTPEVVSQYLQTFGYLYAVFFTVIGSIYPLIALVLLTRRGARAACRTTHDDERRDAPLDGV